jgi:putative SOS response-associated peptidase YedK
MCGRFALFTPPDRLATLFSADLAPDTGPADRPRWNVGPMSAVLGVVARPGAAGPDNRPNLLEAFRWGLVPPWARDPAIGNRLFNARSETVATKPSFRAAYRARRMIVPADGFYEWEKPATSPRRPHFFRRADGEPLALAGLWEVWRDDAADHGPGGELRTCTIITTPANPDVDPVHDRMPAIVERGDLERWLDVSETDLEALDAVLRPARAGTLVHHRVDPRVGNSRNEGPTLVDPLDDRTA